MTISIASMPTSIRLAVAAAVTLLAACTAPEPPRFGPISFADEPVYRLDVAEIVVEDRHDRSDEPPAVGHRFQTPPWEAARIWADERLHATGGSLRTAHYIIERANATETPLPRTTGVGGMFVREQSDRYDIDIAVRLEIRDPSGQELAFVAAQAQRYRTVREDVTYNERRRIWHELTRSTMADVGAELDGVIGKHLARYLAP
jgi:hypothetical protein